MDESLYRFLEFEFEEFYKNSGFEVLGSSEVDLFILKCGINKEKINVLKYETLTTERKKQFRYMFEFIIHFYFYLITY